jgi:hypothetical protein
MCSTMPRHQKVIVTNATMEAARTSNPIIVSVMVLVVYHQRKSKATFA